MARNGRILICGAGPVGLLTAYGLARAGAAVTIFDAEPSVSLAPRANGYHPATLDLLEELELLEEVESRAYRSTDVTFHFPMIGERATLSLAALEGAVKHPYFLHLGQDLLGQIALGRLAGFPDAQIRWAHRLVALEQDGSGIAAIVETPAGREVLRGDWLIGTDGARSTVRTLLELPFEGFTWPDRFVATNVRFDAEAAGYAPSNMVHHPVDWAVVSRLGREDAWRVTYGEDPELPESEIRARIPEHYARIMPPGTKYEVIAAAPYRVHERSAPAYRVGRVLLAGDAAHACNPCGGMGLTGGAFDAAMLIDALAAVAGGTGPESLLDQYSDERRRVFLEISSPTAQGHKQRITSMNKAEQRQAAAQFQAVAADPEVMRQGMMFSFQVRGRPLTLPA